MPSLLDYFLAGARDFGGDVRAAASGDLRGPIFDARRELFARELMRHRPMALLGALLQPQESAMRDAIRERLMQRRAASGYSPFGSFAP